MRRDNKNYKIYARLWDPLDSCNSACFNRGVRRCDKKHFTKILTKFFASPGPPWIRAIVSGPLISIGGCEEVTKKYTNFCASRGPPGFREILSGLLASGVAKTIAHLVGPPGFVLFFRVPLLQSGGREGVTKKNKNVQTFCASWGPPWIRAILSVALASIGGANG